MGSLNLFFHVFCQFFKNYAKFLRIANGCLNFLRILLFLNIGLHLFFDCLHLFKSSLKIFSPFHLIGCKCPDSGLRRLFLLHDLTEGRVKPEALLTLLWPWQPSHKTLKLVIGVTLRQLLAALALRAITQDLLQR